MSSKIKGGSSMPTRRVVTGINAAGKSYFVHDGPTLGHLDLGIVVNDEIWVDDPGRPDPEARVDPVNVETFHLEPPAGGSVVRVFTFMPASAAPRELSEMLGRAASRFDTGHAMERDDPAMHTTRTIDYGIVLSGEIDLELDEGEVHLRPGDVVVQRGTRHAWRNRGSAPCTMAFVLIASSNYR
jgi:mannose-6-phosphate isomerase-like protein (cupin superfamily)